MFPTDADEPSLPAPAPRSGPRGPASPRGDHLGDLVPSAESKPTLAATPSVMGILKALQRRWVLAASVGLLASAAAATATWFVVPPAKYTTRSMLQINSQVPTIIFNTRETKADYEIYRTTQVALVKSAKVLNAALSMPDRKDEDGKRVPAVASLESVRKQVDAIEWLGNQVTVEAGRGSEIFYIGMSGDRPEEISNLVNAVTDAYQEVIVKQENNRRRARMKTLENLYLERQKTLKVRREELRKLATQVGSEERSSLAYSQQLLLGQLDAAKTRLAETEGRLRDIQANLKVHQDKAKRRAAGTPTATATAEEIEEALQDHPTIGQGLAKLEQLRRRHEQVKGRVRNPNDPALLALVRDFKDTQKVLEAEKVRLRPKVAAQLRQARATRPDEMLASLQALQDQGDVQKYIHDQAEQDIRRLQEELKAFNRDFIDVQKNKDEIAQQEDAVQTIGDEIQKMTVEIDAPPRVRVIDPARTPRTRDEYRQVKAAGSAGVATFAMVLILVALWEYRARRIDTVDEVVRGLGLRLVGALPALPETVRRRGIGAETAADRRWQSLLVESVDATRTMLLHASRAEGLQVVMVTSAVKGEGKTSLAGHLAMSLARAGRSTLLVDADLRSPAAHRLFDLPLEPGLCEILREEVEAADAIRSTPASDLDVIPAGRCDARALRALALDGLGRLFDDLKTRYDFVIVDSAPVLPVVDSLLISQHVDAVVLSILREVSRMPEVHSAHERLASLGVRMLGAVVTGTQAQHHYYYADYHNSARAGG